MKNFENAKAVISINNYQEGARVSEGEHKGMFSLNEDTETVVIKYGDKKRNCNVEIAFSKEPFTLKINESGDTELSIFCNEKFGKMELCAAGGRFSAKIEDPEFRIEKILPKIYRITVGYTILCQGTDSIDNDVVINIALI